MHSATISRTPELVTNALERESQKFAKWSLSLLAQSAKNRAGHHPQNGFPSDAYECNLSRKHVFD